MALKRNMEISDPRLAAALAGEGFLLLDGGMGSLIQQEGLHRIHGVPDMLNLTHPEAITAIQRRYVEAGADCITTNTFSANRLKLEGSGVSVEEVYGAAVQCARDAGATLVAGDIGPTGMLLEPLGPLGFEDAYAVFAEQARAAQAAGCQCILIETMADLLEAKAAVLAAVENTALPVIATMTVGEDGRTFMGTTPAIAGATLSALGASAVGLNCSVGPKEMAASVAAMAPFVRGAIAVQPNAGLPRLVDGQTAYDVGPEEFARAMEAILDAGATVVGGCCGTEPAHIAALRAVLDRRVPKGAPRRAAFTVAGAQALVSLPAGVASTAVIGERINPTGKKRLRAALERGDMDYVVGEAAAQQEAGADILDVNVGVAGIDEPAVLAAAVQALQATVPLPLQLDSSNADALEAAARIYAGRPMLNSVNGSAESLEAVLPIAAHYGCTVVGLTLDEGGIPATAEGRLAIAERIVAAAEEAGVPREDVAIDCLVMAAATNQAEVLEILRAVTLVKGRLGVRTVLGVSNVSFGLPARPLVNATFLAAALGAGLDMPILNPLNGRYRDTMAAFRLLNGQDDGCRAFVGAYAGAADPYDGPVAAGALAADAPEARTASGGQAGAPGQGTGGGSAAADGSDAADCGPGAPLVPPPAAAGAGPSLPIDLPDEFADAVPAVAALAACVLEGRGADASAVTKELLEAHDGLAIVNGLFIPLLDEVGRRYDSGRFFLPQLMASAEAAKAGFDVVRQAQAAKETHASATAAEAPAIVLATVQGDIHDIGKNIVGMLLENYGFNVVDLGRDVSPETVVAAAREHGAKLVGLSALMTTTTPAMERTVRLLAAELPEVVTMVGGAVVTAQYAESIGAHHYAKDAAASARIAQALFAQ